jgi:hypothetical protein
MAWSGEMSTSWPPLPVMEIGPSFISKIVKVVHHSDAYYQVPEERESVCVSKATRKGRDGLVGSVEVVPCIEISPCPLVCRLPSNR